MNLEAAAQAFIADAYEVLRRGRIIPTSVFHPHISVGRDYFGPELSGRQPYKQLEHELEAAYPSRFANPLEREHPEFVSTYIFSLLEAAVARSGSTGDFSAGSVQVREGIREMLDLLDIESDEVVCCRVVSHLTGISDQPLAIGDVTVIPETGRFSNSLVRVISKEIPSAPAAFNREAPTVYDPPHSVLVLRGTSRDGSPWDFVESQTRALERFLLGLRLFTGATVRSWYEISGAPTLVARLGPELTTFYGRGHNAIRRTARLDGSEASGIAAINALVESAAVQREGMVATSFDVAITSFHASYRADEGPYEQLVKLATALEATLASGETDVQGLSLRLRSRAATLLATESDPAESIFSDVGLLYALRSQLVHGSQIKKRDVERILRRLSTMPKQRHTMMLGAPLGHMVDRMRDLVRRSLLARLCLADEPDPLWPFDPEFSVDMRLSDDENRRKWRGAWRAKLDELGAASAAEPPRAAADFLSPQDR